MAAETFHARSGRARDFQLAFLAISPMIFGIEEAATPASGHERFRAQDFRLRARHAPGGAADFSTSPQYVWAPRAASPRNASTITRQSHECSSRPPYLFLLPLFFISHLRLHQLPTHGNVAFVTMATRRAARGFSFKNYTSCQRRHFATYTAGAHHRPISIRRSENTTYDELHITAHAHNIFARRG